MKSVVSYLLLLVIHLTSKTVLAQNEQSKWYFNWGGALDFMTSPPTVLAQGSMSTTLSSSSVADPLGNLLFYTDGNTVWNSSHSVMANGTGIMSLGRQGNIILKKPGSTNEYFLITVHGINGLYYSVIDMSLAAGSGSVVTKNTNLYSGGCDGKLTATTHCNGNDFWILIREDPTGTGNLNFKSFLLTSAGISTVSINSTFTSPNVSYGGTMKLSPNGKQLACASMAQLSTTASSFELYDFDNTTGVISNQLILMSLPLYGSFVPSVEFSNDCSKLYGSANAGTGLQSRKIFQWNLCAGTSSSITTSQFLVCSFTVAASNILTFGDMQLAIDGKIYITTSAGDPFDFISVINNPNLSGAACNFVYNGQPVPTGANRYMGLPNFATGATHVVSPPYTYTASNAYGCQGAQFTAPSINNVTLTSCASTGYSVTGYLWDFGDPLSAASNTSGLANPLHTFSNLGTYTTQLILYYSCGGGTDTLRQLVNVTQSCISVSSTSVTCANLGSATVIPTPGLGPFTYTWLPVGQTGSVATGLIPGTHTLTFYDANSNFTFTSSVTFVPLIPLTGTISKSSSITCNGASTGTASVTNLAGGSGAQSYLFTNGSQSYTTAFTNSLSAGNWSLSVTDSVTGCQIHQTFSITQPPPLVLNLSATTPTICIGGSIVLTGTNSGGTPGYSYTWTAGPTTSTQTISETIGGTYIYSLNSSDANTCLITTTIALYFINNPTLLTNNAFICPLTAGTLTVSGATTYTWTSTTLSLTGTTFTDNPLSTQQYSVLGTAFGCTSAAVATIILMPTPNPIVISNSILCEGTPLTLIAYGGVSNLWLGPNGFNSTSQTNTISSIALNQAGIYNVTVTAANTCTASTSTTVLVNPSPSLSVVGSTLCTSQTLHLNASSNASNFLWTGPQNFSSNSQNPFIVNPSTSKSGAYVLKITSALGCTNSAIANVLIVPPPSLTAQLSSHSLCSQAFNGSPNTITLTAGGAVTYSLVTVPDMFNANPSGPVSPLSAIPPNTGIASATLTGSNGVCTVTMGLTFSIVPNPTVVVSSPTPVICAGETYTYSSQGASSYTWSSATPGFTTYNNGGVAVTNPSVNSVFSVFGGSLGCNSASQTSSITVKALPTLSIGPQTPTVCIGSKVILTANGTANSYTWLPYVLTNSASGSIVSVRPTSQQTYTVIGSLNSCTNVAIITVSVLSLPSPTITVLHPKVCLNETITLQGFGGEVYKWNTPNYFDYQGQTISFKAGSPSYAGTYTLTATDANGCEAKTNTEITVYNLPSGDLQGKMDGCVPLHSEFNFYSSPDIEVFWELDQKTSTDKNFAKDFFIPGTYTINGKYTNTLTNCKNTSSFVINAYPLPIADFTYLPEKPIENLEEVIFTNTSKGEEQTNWNWYFINNKGYISENKNTSYLFTEAGTYPIAMVVTNTWGCKDTLVKAIEVEADFNFYMPNVFTPNGDGRNEVFLAVTRGVKLYDLYLFNRWGVLIFHTSDLAKGWDGTFNSEPCKQDVYVWKVVLSTIHGETKEYKGQVFLTR